MVNLQAPVEVLNHLLSWFPKQNPLGLLVSKVGSNSMVGLV